MRGKIKITTTLRVLTGMHIGGSDAFSPIGAVDKPVIDDPRTGRPIIPGSSLKGKLRSLLAAHLQGDKRAAEPNQDCEAIKRLFGASEPIMRSRLQFSDAIGSTAEDLEAVGLREVIFEHALDRISCQANPRQIERVISGAEFLAVITYNIPENEEEIKEDMANLAAAMRLLQMDYLGGHGSRGSGRVSFKNIRLTQSGGSLKEEDVRLLNETFREIEEYELLSI